nr:MAG TPA: hypothetical protein [Caudoviricetes sp.]
MKSKRAEIEKSSKHSARRNRGLSVFLISINQDTNRPLGKSRYLGSEFKSFIFYNNNNGKPIIRSRRDYGVNLLHPQFS